MTTNAPLTFEYGYDIRSYEPRQDGSISIASICNQFQDIASRHADTLGFGYHDLEQSGHFWVLARLHLKMDRLPGFGESTRILTWPSGNEKLVALRDFLISDQDGLIGRGTSSWVTLNTKTHRPDPPETVLNKRFIPDREHALTFPTRAIKRLKEGEHETTLTARRSDTDINGHVNNTRYVDLCFEALPEEWAQSNRCLAIDIQFRSEGFAGDEFTAGCSFTEEDTETYPGLATWLHTLTRKSDSREIVRLRSWWEAR